MNKKTNEHKDATMIGDALRDAGHKVSDLGEQAGKKSDNLIHNAEELIGKYQKEIINYSETLSTYIQKDPLKAVLIAGGIGLLIGRLLKS